MRSVKVPAINNRVRVPWTTPVPDAAYTVRGRGEITPASVYRFVFSVLDVAGVYTGYVWIFGPGGLAIFCGTVITLSPGIDTIEFTVNDGDVVGTITATVGAVGVGTFTAALSGSTVPGGEFQISGLLSSGTIEVNA